MATDASATPVDAKPKKLKFAARSDFLRELRRRVDAYFEETGVPRRDHPRMYLKTFIVLCWFFGSYAALVWVPMSWPLVLLTMISLGFAGAGVGFNIMHDAGHKAMSKRGWVNRTFFATIDMIGGSSYLWYHKHNIYHHTYSNVAHQDTDIDVGSVARFCPHHDHHPHQRYQHFYLWFLYGLMPFRWTLVADFQEWRDRRIAHHPIPEPNRRETIIFWGGKAVYITLSFIIPMIYHPIWLALLVFAGVTWIEGFVMAVVFQLAHCVEEAQFPLPDPNTGRIENEWAIHQLETTMDFAPKNPFVTWYTGGLNFQAVHHVFPNISHINYPALSKIIQEACREHNVTYNIKPTFRGAFASHYRLLKRLGTNEDPVSVSQPQGV